MALAIGERSLPRYAHKFAPKTFTQPQLLACLVLKRFHKTDDRGIEAILRDHPPLCGDLGLSRVPDHTTLFKAERRLIRRFAVRQILFASVTLLLGRARTIALAAADATGFEAGCISPYFVRRRDRSSGKPTTARYRRFAKLHLVVDCATHLVLAACPKRGPTPDVGELEQLQRQLPAALRVKKMLLDAGYDSEPNHRRLRDAGTRGYIPPKIGRRTDKPATGRWRRLMQRLFKDPSRIGYGQRWQAECVNSMIKRRQGHALTGKAYHRHNRTMLLAAIAHNVMILRCACGGFQPSNPNFFALDPYLRLGFWVMVYSAISSEMFNNSSDQISIQRLLSTSSYQQAKRSLFTYVAIVLPLGPVMYLTGLAMFTFYEHNPLPEGITGDTVLFHFVATQLPAPVPGLILAAMLAAVMSTLDSGINSLATVATKDFYLRIFRKASTEAQQLSFSKLMTAGIGAFAVSCSLMIAMANQRIEQTMIEVTSLWFAFFNVLWPIFLLGVLSRRIRPGHILVLVVGSWAITAGMVVWFLLSRGTERPLSFMLISVPGVAFMLAGGWLLSRLSPPLPRAKLAGLTLWTLGEPAPTTAASPTSDETLLHPTSKD